MDYDNLSFFNSESRSVQLPFYDDWRKKQSFKSKKYYIATEFKQVKSGKGYMLKTTDFTQFYWGNQSTTKQLLEAFKVYLTRPEEGYELIVVVDPDKKIEPLLAANKDKSVTWFYSKKLELYSLQELEQDLEEIEQNPLI